MTSSQSAPLDDIDPAEVEAWLSQQLATSQPLTKSQRDAIAAILAQHRHTA